MIVSVSRMGRLGNRLQLSAYVAAVALELERPAALLGLAPHRHLFAGPREDALCRLPRRTSAWWGATARRGLELVSVSPMTPRLAARRYPGVMLDDAEVLARVAEHAAVALVGYYFYAPRLLVRHAAAIRRYFQPAAEHADSVAQFLAHCRRDAKTLVGVHIRHGDYATYRGGEHFFTADQYAVVLRQLRDQLPGVCFVVCTDAPALGLGDVRWERGPGTTIQDLYALAGCDYVLGPCSTFNRWAAFVGDVPRHELRDPHRPVTLGDFVPVQDLTRP